MEEGILKIFSRGFLVKKDPEALPKDCYTNTSVIKWQWNIPLGVYIREDLKF